MPTVPVAVVPPPPLSVCIAALGARRPPLRLPVPHAVLHHEPIVRARSPPLPWPIPADRRRTSPPLLRARPRTILPLGTVPSRPVPQPAHHGHSPVGPVVYPPSPARQPHSSEPRDMVLTIYELGSNTAAYVVALSLRSAAQFAPSLSPDHVLVLADALHVPPSPSRPLLPAETGSMAALEVAHRDRCCRCCYRTSHASMHSMLYALRARARSVRAVAPAA